MIQRLYIHNYRCYENFEIGLGKHSSVLVLGKNGVGKSTLGNALRILQKIAQGHNRIRELIQIEDIAQHKKDRPVRLEVTVELGGRTFEYSIAVELPHDFKELRILDEQLTCEGQSIYSREHAQVELPASDTRFLVDWHMVALPIIQIKDPENSIETFRSWMSRLILIHPVPSSIHSESNEPTLYPNPSVSNLADWLNGVVGTYPAAYSVIADYLKDVMPDFRDIRNIDAGGETKISEIRFGVETTLSLKLHQLSDGEKSFIICALLMGLARNNAPIFCLWDEPDSSLSIGEVGDMILELQKSFKGNGQILVTSHNSETIRAFSDESTLVLDRNSHLEPTTAQWLKDVNYHGDLIESLILA